MVRGGGAPLHVGDDGLGRVAFCREILLCQSGLHLLSCLADGIADSLADSVGLDDVVGSVDLGQTLAFGSASLYHGEDHGLVNRRRVEKSEKGTDEATYSVASGKLLLCADNGTLSQSLVELSRGLDCGSNVGGAAAASAGADLDLLVINEAHFDGIGW